jgi:hypothetical protein
VWGNVAAIGLEKGIDLTAMAADRLVSERSVAIWTAPPYGYGDLTRLATALKVDIEEILPAGMTLEETLKIGVEDKGDEN